MKRTVIKETVYREIIPGWKIINTTFYEDHLRAGCLNSSRESRRHTLYAWSDKIGELSYNQGGTAVNSSLSH